MGCRLSRLRSTPAWAMDEFETGEGRLTTIPRLRRAFCGRLSPWGDIHPFPQRLAGAGEARVDDRGEENADDPMGRRQRQ